MRVMRGAVALLLTATLWAQSQLISVPIDPAVAKLEIGKRRPDGTQFVLLVTLSGSPPIRFVASREDAVQRQIQQFTEITKLNEAEEKRLAIVRGMVAQKQAKVTELTDSKNDLMNELSKAQSVIGRARRQVHAESAAAAQATPPTGTMPSPAPPPPATPSTPPAANADAQLDQIPGLADLVTIPVPDNAVLRIVPETMRPNGTQFALELTAGGIHLRYVASREDVVATQIEQFQLQTALRSRLEAENRNLEAQSVQLDAKSAILEVDVMDLRSAVVQAKENMIQLAEILKAQRPKWWEIMLQALPTIAGIAALAAR